MIVRVHWLCFRISEAVRMAGSLIFILLLFILTAVLVKVPMNNDTFFSVTMATIWFINCKWVQHSVYNEMREVKLQEAWVITASSSGSFQRRAAGQLVRPGGSAASEVQLHLHERSGARGDFCRHRHANLYSQ